MTWPFTHLTLACAATSTFSRHVEPAPKMAQPGHPATLFGACQALLKLLKVTKQSVRGAFKSDGARTSEVMHLLSHPPSPSELSGNLSDDD